MRRDIHSLSELVGGAAASGHMPQFSASRGWQSVGFAHNVRTYGATGDGATDDTAAIMAAATAAGAGGTVHFPAGTYMVKIPGTFASAIDLQMTGITLHGEPGAVIKLDASTGTGTYLIGLQANDITIDGLTLDGNAEPSAVGVNLYAFDIAHACIRNCTFRHFDGGSASACIDLARHHTDIRIIGNQFYDFTYGILSNMNVSPTFVAIIGNTFDGNNIAGDAIEINSPTGNASDFAIVGNVIRNSATAGVANGIGIGLAHVVRATIVGNLVRNCGLDGIHVEDGSTDVTINGNTVTGCGRTGIAVNSSNAARFTKRIAVVGNTVEGCGITGGSGGIAFEGTQAVHDCTVISNTVRNCGRAGATYFGIDIQFGAAGHRVIGNAVSQTLGATTAGIRLGASSDVLLSGNRCWDDSGGPQDYGLVVSGNQTRVQIVHNDFASNGTGAIDESGIGTQTNYVKADNLGSAPPTYAASNVTTDRTYDANATTLDEVADALGTLIADLRAQGVVT